MDYLKPVLLALALACAGAYAQAPAAPADTRKTSAEVDAKSPPKRKVLKRRSVQQVIEPTPRIVTQGDRPALVSSPPAALPAPVRINSCDAGGCTDTSGQRYNGGVGTTLIGPQGQLCTKGVVNAQCF
jgi:hypothetical protein